MKHTNNNLKQMLVWIYLAVLLLAACTPSPIVNRTLIPYVGTQDMPTSTGTQTPSFTATSTPLPAQSETPTLTPTQDMWKIQECRIASNIIEEHEYDWIWIYSGDLAGRGNVDMLLNFTKSNEILGFYFDIEQVHEYQVSGCVEGRAFTIWLHQGNNVEAVIQGEFPETDPRGHYSSTEVLKGDVLAGSLLEKVNPQQFPIYLQLLMGTAGTFEHRFKLAGVEDDSVILEASQKFLASVANDNRAQVAQMIKFPMEFYKDGKTTLIGTSDLLFAQYDEIFDSSFKTRLAKTFPNYMIAYAGSYIGTIGLSVYGGGGIDFDDHGRVIAISNWQKPVSTQTPTKTPGGDK